MDGHVFIVAGAVNVGYHSQNFMISKELTFYTAQCTKGEIAAAVDATVALAPWKSPATPIIKRPTMDVIFQIIDEKSKGQEKRTN